MQQKEDYAIKDAVFISIKKLAALDIVFHGPKVILAEFGLTVGLGGLLAAFSLSLYVKILVSPFNSGLAGTKSCFIQTAGERLVSPHGSTDRRRSFFPWQPFPGHIDDWRVVALSTRI